MEFTVSRDQESAFSVTVQPHGRVLLNLTASLKLVATPTQAIDWLLKKSQVAYAEFRPKDRPRPLTYQPDEPYTKMPPSVLIVEDPDALYTVHCYNVLTYSGDLHGVIRFLVDILPRHNESPPRL